MANHPHFEETAEEDCGCDGADAILTADDTELGMDRIIEVFTPQRVEIDLTFRVGADYESINSLVQQYRSISEVPGSEGTQKEIVGEIDRTIGVLTSFESLVMAGLETTIRGILDENPALEVLPDDSN
jgi:hypothetical protein